MNKVQCSSYMVINKNEWERIKKQTKSADEELPVNPKEKTIAELNELSQKWVKNWPNSFEGAGDRLLKKKEKKEKQKLALIQEYNNAKKLMRDTSTSEAIKKARQILFERSSYGRQLWGALIESKVLEEREAQIKFNNELKKKQADSDKTQEQFNSLPTLNTDEDENKRRKKLINVQFAKTNRELAKIKKATDAKIKEEEILRNKIDEHFIKPIIEKEKDNALTLKRLQKEAVEKYEAEQKEIAKIKIIRTKNDDAITERYQKEKDRLQSKINATHKKIINDFQNSTKSKHTYDIIEKTQKEKIKQYNDFIEKGVKRYEENQKTNELKANEKEKLKKNHQTQLATNTEINTNHLVYNKKLRMIKSERSNLLLKKSKQNVKLETQYRFTEPPLTVTEPLSLKEQLKLRKKEKSPFTGTAAAHETFAEQAATVLQDCKYKHLPTKVIYNYRKLNNLDTSAPVLNFHV